MGFTHCLKPGWEKDTCRKLGALLLVLDPQCSTECKQDFSISSIDISWQFGGIKYPNFSFFLNNFPWINVSPKLPSLQDNLGFSSPYTITQQKSFPCKASRVSPIPGMWERMHRTEVCSTWMVWPNSWSHACGIANMRAKTCLKSFQVKHSSTFCSLWNTAGWKVLTVWSIRLWNSSPREVLGGLSIESFSAEGNILQGAIPH